MWSYPIITAASMIVTFKLCILSSCLQSSHMSCIYQICGDISFFCSLKLILITIVYISVCQLTYIFCLCNKPAFDHILMVIPREQPTVAPAMARPLAACVVHISACLLELCIVNCPTTIKYMHVITQIR